MRANHDIITEILNRIGTGIPEALLVHHDRVNEWPVPAFKSFEKLGYKNPDLEAKLLLINMDGMATRFFLQKNFDLTELVSHMYKKYDL